MKEFKIYRRLIESMHRLDLAENPSGMPQPTQPTQPKQPLQEYEVPVHGKRGIYYRRQKVKKFRPGYRIPGADEQQTPTAPQPQAQPQMPTAQRRPTEQELATPQQPSDDFKSRVAGRTPTQGGQTEQEQTTMELISKTAKSVGGQQTSTQAAHGTSVPQIDLGALHEDFMKTLKTTTEIGKHPKEYTTYHHGRDESTKWHLAPSYRTALAEIERRLGHPMLLGGLLCAAAGFPAYLETRAGYGKTTMAFALKQRIDSLYNRLGEDKEAARELAQLPFADVIIVEPKTDVTELVGYLYVASVADPSRGRDQDPRIVEDLARFLHAEGRAETIEEARELASEMVTAAVNTMTAGSISGTTAIAPTAEVKTALQRATRWRMPNGRLAKPVLFVYDDAHTPANLRMMEARLKTALAANAMYGMPYLAATHLLFANPNEEEVTPEFASRLMPWITPTNVTSEYGLRGEPDVSELIREAGREIAEVALEKALGKSIDQIKGTSEILSHADDIQKAFEEEVKERLEYYGLTRDEENAIRKMKAVEYLTGDLGTPHYMDAIATAVSRAGLDAVTAGWLWRPPREGRVRNIYSLYSKTPGYKAAYTPEELMEVAERHAAFASAVQWNRSMALTLFKNPSTPEWKKVKEFIDKHLPRMRATINWYNERSARNRGDTIDAAPDRSPRDWQRFVRLSALFGAMGRPDMVAYTIGMVGGIDPEVPMPEITVNDSPAAIDEKLDEYFKAENLSPSVHAMLSMLREQKLTPEEYAEGLKQYARAVIFTTQAESGAGEHTIYSILKPNIETILQHGTQTSESTHSSLVTRILSNQIVLPRHSNSEIYQDTPWYQGHRANFKELFDNLYREHKTDWKTEDKFIEENAEAAHAALSILAGLMRSMHATNAIGSQERNAILKSAEHASEQLRDQQSNPIRSYVSSAARMAAALRRFTESNKNYDALDEEDIRELHKFGHLVALAHATDSQGNFVLPAEKLKEIKDLVETVHGIATTRSEVRAGASAEGVGSFAPLTEKRWSAEFADALAKILSLDK